MKKYRLLGAGEVVQAGDEQQLLDMRWVETKAIHHIVTLDDNQPLPRFRRPVPYTGKVAFLVTVSATTRVVLDTDGLSDEEIDERLAEMACEKISTSPNRYIVPENVDWENTKEDLECPAEDEKIPASYRYLEAGEYTKAGDETLVGREWVVLDESDGGMLVTKRSPMEYRRPITEPQYRPFKEGDVIEEGDQWRWNANSEWQNAGEIIIGDKVVGNIAGHDDWRKLIK